MAVPNAVKVFLNAHSCEDIIKDFFVGDVELLTNVCKDVVLITQKVMELDENSSAELLKKADDRHVVALLLLLSLFTQYTSIVNRLVHKISVALRLDLSNYDDVFLTEYAKALDIPLDFSERCFLETMYIVVKNRRQSVVKTCYNYRLAINDYLKVAKPLLTEESWKIISFPMLKGYVYMDSRVKVARLLSEYLKYLLVSKLHQLSSQCTVLTSNKDFMQVLEDFKKIMRVDKVAHFSELKKSSIVSVTTSVRSLKEVFENMKNVDELYNASKSLFPPCISSIVESLMRSENISHHQRFALATFLINLDIPQNLIIDLFKRSPDFNERITRYQIEHLQGLKGSKKRYLTYNCDTMKALNMCKAECGIRNPLQYPYKVASKNKVF